MNGFSCRKRGRLGWWWWWWGGGQRPPLAHQVGHPSIGASFYTQNHSSPVPRGRHVIADRCPLRTWTWLDLIGPEKKTPRLRWRVVFPQVPVSGHVPQCGETHGHLRPKERHTHNDGEQKENSVEASRSSPGRPPKPPGRSRCTSPGFGRCWARRSCKRPSTDERERERERERDKNELSWTAGRHYDDTIGTDR